MKILIKLPASCIVLSAVIFVTNLSAQNPLEGQRLIAKSAEAFLFELTEKDDADAAFEGMVAWQAAARARGIEPRGVLPCKNYVRCGGEVVEVNENRQGWLSKLFGR